MLEGLLKAGFQITGNMANANGESWSAYGLYLGPVQIPLLPQSYLFVGPRPDDAGITTRRDFICCSPARTYQTHYGACRTATSPLLISHKRQSDRVRRCFSRYAKCP